MKGVFILAGSALLLTGCGGGSSVSRSFETAPPANSSGVADYPVKIGEPYELDGITYTPSDAYNYDETGFASWYGKELTGRNTANGEMFEAEAITGAHRTLPLPSYAEVTALDSGKTILVRLNDRGPSARNRLIDLSYGAAKQLGVADKGVFSVRVRRVNPPEAERAVLRTGQPVAMRMETPESLLVPLRRRLDGKPRPTDVAAAGRGVTPAGNMPAKPDRTPPAAPVTPANPPVAKNGTDRFIVEGAGSRPQMVENSTGDNRATLTPTRPAQAPAPTPAPRPAPAPAPRPAPTSAAAGGGYFVQVAAFGSRARADELAKKIGGSTQTSGNGKLFRVRYGPYADANAAQQGLTLAKRNGYQEARIQKDAGR